MHQRSAPQGAIEPSLRNFLTTEEAAKATGLTVSTLDSYRSLRRKGLDKGPEFVTRGRAVFYPLAAVEAFLATSLEV
ncbi:helix-turn-helix transcriptional regulator [Parvularcula maris]|uniref:Helix-turn-helix domain-containing protein n=1 Tax=Parvularcula maris TaxID=2965077 RepID=A0A9X2LB11_9PROT|nr:helix-turn-helix domain-containing protein [Parvularcula maris]MCQ8186430.1 helix-turn-helix domain-containing protein [Parvularcula maris]